jgi:hypothetical protein
MPGLATALDTLALQLFELGQRQQLSRLVRVRNRDGRPGKPSTRYRLKAVLPEQFDRSRRCERGQKGSCAIELSGQGADAGCEDAPGVADLNRRRPYDRLLVS